MTTEQGHEQSTNGRVRVEKSIEGAREVLRKRRSPLRRLAVPALLMAGVFVLWRRFEQGAGE